MGVELMRMLRMTARGRLFFLSGIMATVSSTAVALTLYLLYKSDPTAVRAAFWRASVAAGLLTLGLVILGSVLFLWMTDPLVRRLEESEKQFRAVFNQTFQFLWLLGPDGKLLEANQAALDAAGVVPMAVRARPLWQTRWWDGLPIQQTDLQAAVTEAAAGNFVRRELELRGFGDRRFALDFSLKPLTNSEGHVVQLLAEGRDITERKQAGRELAKRTAYLDALIENSPLAIVVQDADGLVRMCNPAFERLFQYRQAEIVGQLLDGLIAPAGKDEEALGLTRRAMRGSQWCTTTERRRRDGTLVEVELHAVPLWVDQEIKGAYGIYQDITERRRHEAERERLVQELQEALGNVKTLRGLLPICASCKNVRDDQGYWSRIEIYLRAHSEAEFSHGICPACAKQLYPEHYRKMYPELADEESVKE